MSNTLRFTSRQIQVEPIQQVAIDEASTATRLAGAIRFQTVSYQDSGQIQYGEFVRLHRYLEHSFPKLHSTLTKEVIGQYSLLYKWQGRNEKLKPIVLMAHQDVVPVEPNSLANWEQPPFEGRVINGYIWGRGAIDDKFALMSIMEAIELQLAHGFQPQRTVYLAFGHDEEVGGRAGAAQIADLLQKRGVDPEYVLDEGSSITVGFFRGINQPVALLGIADKGYLSLELSVATESGHSSMPPDQTAIGILSAAVSKLEQQQLPATLGGVPLQTLDYVGREMPLGKKLAMANLWLFKPLLVRQLSALPSTMQSLRTTTAPTMIEGGFKENVLPNSARAVVNFRLLSADSSERVVAHVTSVVDDPRVHVKKFGVSNSEPSTVSDVRARGYQIIERTLRQVFPGILVAPALCIGGTDSEYYAKLTKNIYRFSPLRLRPEDIERLHGMNERTSIKDFAGSVKFYYHLISNSAQ